MENPNLSLPERILAKLFKQFEHGFDEEDFEKEYRRASLKRNGPSEIVQNGVENVENVIKKIFESSIMGTNNKVSGHPQTT